MQLQATSLSLPTHISQSSPHNQSLPGLLVALLRKMPHTTRQLEKQRKRHRTLSVSLTSAMLQMQSKISVRL